MNKFILKYKFPLVVLFVSLILIISAVLFTQEQEKERVIMQDEISAQQQAQKKVWEANEEAYLMGMFDPAQREDFSLIPLQYTLYGNIMYLRTETLNAFIKMADAAEENGIKLRIVSATRNFDYQKMLWEKKWTGATLVEGKDLSKTVVDGLERFKKILEYTAVPGTSRHYWGTDIDINDTTTAFAGKEYDWLVKNAEAYGFCQTYNSKGNTRPEGYSEEKWHWSYVPLSSIFTQEYKSLIRDEDIKGFLGDEYVSNMDLIDSHVLGINPDCL